MQYQNYIGNLDIIIKTLQGHHIDSVGWNWQNANDSTTGAILLGTSKGKKHGSVKNHNVFNNKKWHKTSISVQYTTAVSY